MKCILHVNVTNCSGPYQLGRRNVSATDNALPHRTDIHAFNRRACASLLEEDRRTLARCSTLHRESEICDVAVVNSKEIEDRTIDAGLPDEGRALSVTNNAHA